MNQLTELFKVLSDETRLRIINLIKQQKLCVCELVDVMNESQPKISKHIAKLRSINLVNTERNEQYIYYSLNTENTEYMRILDAVFQTEINVLISDNKKLEKVETFVCSK